MAHKSIMFIGPFMNFIFLGLQASRRKYSAVKNITVMTSMTLMIWRSRGNSTSPSSLYWSSSIVDIIKVKVDIKTIESEKNAQKLERGYIKYLWTHVMLKNTVQFCLSKDTLKYDAWENIYNFLSLKLTHCVPEPWSPFSHEVISKILFVSQFHLFLLRNNITVFFILSNLIFIFKFIWISKKNVTSIFGKYLRAQQGSMMSSSRSQYSRSFCKTSAHPFSEMWK